MTRTTSSNVSPFPSGRVSAQAANTGVPRRSPHLMQVAPDLFMIDEPDPLLISERPTGPLPGPRTGTPSLKVVEGPDRKSGSKLRIRDLHPIDLAIMLGIVLVCLLV